MKHFRWASTQRAIAAPMLLLCRSSLISAESSSKRSAPVVPSRSFEERSIVQRTGRSLLQTGAGSSRDRCGHVAGEQQGSSVCAFMGHQKVKVDWSRDAHVCGACTGRLGMSAASGYAQAQDSQTMFPVVCMQHKWGENTLENAGGSPCSNAVALCKSSSCPLTGVPAARCPGSWGALVPKAGTHAELLSTQLSANRLVLLSCGLRFD